MKNTRDRSLPSFADAHYSVAHDNVFNTHNRLRVARQIHATLIRYFRENNLNNKLCLDIGSSTGIITSYLSQFFHRTNGVDIDPYAVAFATEKRSGKNLEYYVGSAMELPFNDNTYDVVVCNETLSYVDDQSKALDEVYRVLKPGGVCFLTADNALFPIESQYKLPFIHWLPQRLAQYIVLSLGHKNYFLGNLKTYWQLARLFHRFVVHDYTLRILQNPRRYQYVRLYKYQPFIHLMPSCLCRAAKFFVPTFVFIIQKPQGNISPSARAPIRR